MRRKVGIRMPSLRRINAILVLGTLLLLLIATAVFPAEKLRSKIRLHARDYGNDLAISKRALTWENAIKNGSALYCAMNGDDAEAAIQLPKVNPIASTWTDNGDLLVWKWNINDLDSPESSYGDNLDSAFKALSVDKSTNTRETVDQDRKFYINNIGYSATDALYYLDINEKAGLIVVDNTLSPQEARKQQGSSDPTPSLSRWSDVVFLQWQNAVGNVKNLNHVIRSNIQNTESLSIMQKALGESTTFDWGTLGTTPSAGKTFYPNSDGFNALLYTPNCRGVAWLLIQHKAQMGRRSISQISIFGEDNGDPAIYLKIVAVS